MLRVNISINPASSEILARFSVRKEGKSKGVNSQMPFNAIGGFVETKAFRLNTGVAGIFHCLGVNDDQRRKSVVFFTCSRTCPCKTLISSLNTPPARH